MAGISVGAAIGAGFGLIARRPLAVLVWGAIPMAISGLTLALMAPFYLTIIASAAAGGGAPPSALTPQLLQMQGVSWILNFVQLGASALIYCAVFRAVLHPEQSRAFYLRVGAAELFTVVLMIAAFIVLFVGLLLLMIPLAIIVGVGAAVSHQGGGGFLALIPLVAFAVLIMALVLALRFAFAVPMMVDDGQFHLFESWTLSRGRLGSLVLIALGLLGVLIVGELLVLIPVLGLGAGAIGMLGGPQAAAALIRQSPGEALGRIWPLLAVWIALFVPISGGFVAIGGAPWARAYQDLRPDSAEVFR